MGDARWKGSVAMSQTQYAFMLNVDDWLSSSDVQAMSAVEYRGLMQLLCHGWKELMHTGKGLVDDDESLSRWAMVSLRQWRSKIRAKLMKLFELRDGRWYNARLQREYENFRAKATGRSEHASTAAKSRWDREKSGRKGGMEKAGDLLRKMPPAIARVGRDAADARECSEHPTGIQKTEIHQERSEQESPCFSSPSFEKETSECGTGTDGAMANLTPADVQNARELLTTVAKRTGMDEAKRKSLDTKLTVLILTAAGSVNELLSHLAALEKRNLSHVDSYGYFLRLIQARQAEAKAG
jgi:uncharacterized protein YdaU (DUF1376 family)